MTKLKPCPFRKTVTRENFIAKEGFVTHENFMPCDREKCGFYYVDGWQMRCDNPLGFSVLGDADEQTMTAWNNRVKEVAK